VSLSPISRVATSTAVPGGAALCACIRSSTAKPPRNTPATTSAATTLRRGRLEYAMILVLPLSVYARPAPRRSGAGATSVHLVSVPRPSAVHRLGAGVKVLGEAQ